MNPAPTRCPVCQSELEVTRLRCNSCDTALEGHFFPGQFANLTAEQISFVLTFVRCEGKINRVEQEMSLSYPTIRNRLHEVIRALGYEPGKEELAELTQEQRNAILEDLQAGKITAEEATRLLRGEEE